VSDFRVPPPLVAAGALALACVLAAGCRAGRPDGAEIAVAARTADGYRHAMTQRFARIDVPEVSGRIFFPRPDPGDPPPPGSTDLMVPVADGVSLHARFHAGPAGGPVVLLFHGNGEIVADYDDVAEVYQEMGAALIVVDYRGYGRSGGLPTPSSIVVDADAVLTFVRERLAGRGAPPIVLFGRSLGSAPAIHLAATRGSEVAALIVESGFARTLPLLRLVGVPVDRLGLREEDGFTNSEVIRRVRVPTLLLHADEDSIIPFEDATINFEACGAEEKKLVVIEGADHNSIMAYGGRRYWGAIRELLARAGGVHRGGAEHAE
jgi:alpha-beta hydrolase superfamily lysophospholipase